MLTYSLERRGKTPMYEFLYRCIRDDIDAGVLESDSKLPSKRALARHLGISLITVEGAYSQLVAEGYIYSRPRSGFYVHDVHGDAGPGHCRNRSSHEDAAHHKRTGQARTPTSFSVSPPHASNRSRMCINLSHGGIDSTLFPYSTWAKSFRRVLTGNVHSQLDTHASPFGSPYLQEVLAKYLHGFRGIDAKPRQIIIGAGAQSLYQLLIQFFGHSIRVGVEDPGYPKLTSIYRNNQIPMVHVPVDSQGMRIDVLASSGATLAHVTPSHQFPSSVVTSAQRRYELLQWAGSSRYIIEDDYDCEFRFAGRPIPALYSLAPNSCVIYANTFTKTVGQAFRIGYMVLPEHLLDAYRSKLGGYSCTASPIDQMALAHFIDQGHYERHLFRVRKHYRDIHNRLLLALTAADTDRRLEFFGQDSGLHFLLGIRTEIAPRDMAAHLAKAGIIIEPLCNFRENDPPEKACAITGAPRDIKWFVMRFAGLGANAVDKAAHRLLSVINALP